VGPDALTLGKAFDRQWNPRFLFDIPRRGVPLLVEQAGELAAARGLDARLVELPGRVSHLRRAVLALDAGDGAGKVQLHGLGAAVVGGLPVDAPLRVVGETMPEGHPEAGRLRRVAIIARDGRVARSELFAHVSVDRARLLAIDLEAGRDAERIAAMVRAPRIGDTEFGWRDLTLAAAEAHASDVLRARESTGAVFAQDYRPHTHEFYLLEQFRAGTTDSGVVSLGGATACGFATSWGDGLFEVHRDLDADGRLLRVRVELGTEARVELMAKLRFRWTAQALVSRQVLEGGEPIGFMYRTAPAREGDSGWRMFSGFEEPEFNQDPRNFALVRLQDFGEADASVDALLDEPAGSAFERQPGEDEFRRVDGLS
jgi:hypothetical protein